MDQRALLINPGPTLFGGPECLPCPPCNTWNSKCVSDNSTTTSTTRVCACFENWSHSNNASTSTMICDAPVCPWITGQSGPCGQNKTNPDYSTGICVWGGGISPYLGHCECYDGFGGNACQTLLCPLGANGKVCSGTSAAMARPIDLSTENMTAHAFCNETSGQCECLPGWTSGTITDALYWKVPYNSCALIACAMDNYGNECNGLTYNGGLSVCDRSPLNPRCQCQWAISSLQSIADPNRFFGPRM